MSSTEKIIGASNNTHGTYLNELDNITCVNKIVVSVSGYKESSSNDELVALG